ncbi:2-amino-4-hydroxy-6-hydroxymethyldihydropteridine diphosphokinase [Polynucleobacter paneuropaeus]|uniref:2-amino-4-hydroxy-6-hydroxymethyldihydropteridine pyrophosphokinase n=1 Tax=Polynucleobacter paneuropaeus TaxID=2527775 RepID=A0AAE2YKN8_9BURK|nr:2-amino-4-hydroxy-6-hydroxymethyldihydropteridine diphosphokinase [Polynucleobacter paneuropaeus]MBT8591212.1 2-amino-4-hydroxy-6-hydroxymethyldihydropteridine diphosphokinase [Polynucleobacter paneuropaeus]MBT8596602.1 2-amino-4-hydroxy-6-hydroxymethyldihydropteridine diphosphokinase [Polynucleobacter paneuropaeus]MBT8598415.1 2-amino-4-hydroxy-6-hydroxymethyldihydropteridine diphosphokinase [Polynucleobacter paneuropaeus]
MAQAFIGFGGNVGDTHQIITDAIVCLALRCELTITAKSCFYQSAPVDALGGDYINAVVEIDTELSPYGLLHVCQAIEQQFGRERPYANAPRTLDLDILFFEGVTQNETNLILPHPRIIERSFVLLPLLEIAPDFFDPQFGELKAHLPKVAHQRIEKLSCRNCNCGENTVYSQSVQ